jgi:hypothetical protein
MSAGRICTALILILASCSVIRAEDQPHNYEKLHDIEVRGLSLRDIVVTAVSFPSPASDSAHPIVRLLFTRGVLTVGCGTAAESCLSGALANGPKTPSVIEGEFTWHEGKIQSLGLKELQLRVRGLSIKSPIAGGLLNTDPQFPVTLRNVGLLSFGSAGSSGVIDLLTSHCQINSAHVELANLSFSVSLTASAGAHFQLTLADGKAKPVGGDLLGDRATALVTAPVSTLFGQTVLQKGTVEIRGLRLGLKLGVASITSLSVVTPSLTHANFPNLPIVAAAALRASQIDGQAIFDPMAIRIPTPTVKIWEVQTDPFEVMNRLNQHWVQDQDVLLPTGDPTLHYITLSALDSFYRQLARAEWDTSNLYRVYLKTNTDAMDGISSEIIPPPSGQRLVANVANSLDPPSRTPKICLIFDGVVGSTVASITTTYLLGMVITQSMVVSTSYATALTVATILAPEFGAPVFLAVYGTTYLMQAVAGTVLANHLTNGAKQYCEVLLGQGKPGKIVALPSPSDNASQTYEQQMYSRYQGYVAARRDAGLGMAPNVSTPAYSFLRQESEARASYNHVVDFRAKAWDSKRQEDLKALKSEEAQYQQGMAQREAEVRAQNARTGTDVIRQAQENEEKSRALQNTPVISTPLLPSQGSPKIKTYINVQPQ